MVNHGRWTGGMGLLVLACLFAGCVAARAGESAQGTDAGSGAGFATARSGGGPYVHLGGACAAETDCAPGHSCVDGVCCDSTCGGGDPHDCQACSVAAGAARDGRCGVVQAGHTCRASAGSCDVPEVCDGVATSCPADAVKSAGTLCRAVAGVCDVEEDCDGASPQCPVDAFVAAGTVCRAAAGVCDVAEDCTGSSADCPANAFVAMGTECRASVDVCDVAEDCTGSGADCPADGFAAMGTECRASAGACDVAETCSGSGVACPSDGVAPAGTACGTNGTCDGTAIACVESSPTLPGGDDERGRRRCNDGNPCTHNDRLDADGVCVGIPVACAAGATCDQTTCCTGVAVDCDDGDPCTEDWCGPVDGCLHHRLGTPECGGP